MKRLVAFLLGAVGIAGCGIDEPVKPPCMDPAEDYCKGECVILDSINADSCLEDVLICKAGFQDCDGIIVNGCESDLMNDLNHCGECGTQCESNESCSAGRCESKCGDKCLDFQQCSDEGICINKSCVDDNSICDEGYSCKLDGKCYISDTDDLAICDNEIVKEFVFSSKSLDFVFRIFDISNTSDECSEFQNFLEFYMREGEPVCNMTKGCLDTKDIIKCLSDNLLEGVAYGRNVEIGQVIRMNQLLNGTCFTNSCMFNDNVCFANNICKSGYCKDSEDEYQCCNSSIIQDIYDGHIKEFIELMKQPDDVICTSYKEFLNTINNYKASIKIESCLDNADPLVKCGQKVLTDYSKTTAGTDITEEMIDRFVKINVSCWDK